MLSKLLRIIIALTGGILGYGGGAVLIMLAESTGENGTLKASPVLETILPIGSALLLMVVCYLLFPFIKKKSMRVTRRIEGDLQAVPFNDVISGTVGLICGLVIAYLISQPLMKLDFFYVGTALSVLAYIFFGYLGVSVATKGVRKEMNRAGVTDERRGLINSMFKSRSAKNTASVAAPKILDTSVIIDGRIADILDTGFVEGKIIIPEFVLEELRHISDSADSMKRAKGRRGLDILKDIQAKHGIEIYNTYDKSFVDIPEVDVKLLKLAGTMGGKVLTTDYNLLKVAEIQGIPVLNINQLVRALRPVLIPGEMMMIAVIKEGKESNQGVGYMDDGTMIVIEDGKRLIGTEVNVEVTSVLQTASGRMIFAKPTNRR